MPDFTDIILKHENLEPKQTPFRITDPSMKKWVSMFDDTMKLKLDPKAKKSEGREEFLYLQNQEDLKPAVTEQFRRYYTNPRKYKLSKDVSVAEAVRKFDQTGADGKIEYLKQNGIDTSKPLREMFPEAALAQEVKRQM
jgi:hypothetical protein